MKPGKILLVVMCGIASFAAWAADAFAIPRAEFAKYCAQITGKAPAADLVTFAVDKAISTSGRDAYTIVSAGNGVKITGSNARSVLYGVYDLLERRGGCHWFWDGDVVQKKAAIDLAGLDIREEARFEYRGLRYFAHRGLTRFQAEHWGLVDWKKEIDWILKRRLNVFMLRIGQDDLFQRTFPETCVYPDPANPLPGAGKGYDNRSLFWSLEFRGKLRHDLQQYAFARGLLVPEDFGTMTHWYSRTPEDFLAKKDPPFLPQATRGYSEKNGLVWDIRDDKWADAYWKLTTTAVEAYGQGAPERLLHTIGLGERKCYTNRQDNFNLKLEALGKFMSRAKRDYPDAKVLLAGWDFYFTWQPEEVQALIKTLDPKHAIIWDYEGDVTHYRPGYSKPNDFTQWGVVGKFPYTYSIFLAYESALDTRANYPLIEERQKLVQNDPACAGYILWPESSHTDTLCLRYFTANAWSSTAVPHQAVLDEFCASRYGAQAAAMKAIWTKALPLSWMMRWRGGCNYVFTDGKSYPAENAEEITRLANWKGFEAAPEIFAGLARMPWADDFLRRDTVDVARMALDRVIVYRANLLKRDYLDWQKGARDGADLPARAANVAALMEKMADLLALHTDYSLWESYLRLDA
ncbi:MAG: alpha-N-acetylglucosaminidase N-terminal domain-containing protein, partial [Kiritimatiellae bacterium]|nr:alpha-N-acetylglucosaminidase N-terminal domain-containing protein [Kiritimatiellia bacterium]